MTFCLSVSEEGDKGSYPAGIQGIHLCLAVVLSEAKPTGCRLLHLSFPARESSILLRDDSSGNLGLGSLSGGIATLNPRLNLDYPLSGKELSDFSCQLSDFRFQFSEGIQRDKGSEGTEFLYIPYRFRKKLFPMTFCPSVSED